MKLFKRALIFFLAATPLSGFTIINKFHPGCSTDWQYVTEAGETDVASNIRFAAGQWNSAGSGFTFNDSAGAQNHWKWGEGENPFDDSACNQRWDMDARKLALTCYKSDSLQDAWSQTEAQNRSLQAHIT